MDACAVNHPSRTQRFATACWGLRTALTWGVAVCIALKSAQAEPEVHPRFAQRTLERLAPIQPPVANPNNYLETLPNPHDDPSEGSIKTWWETAVHQPLNPQQTPISITLEQMLFSALTHSAQIRVIKEVPLIRETAIVEAEAEFDWASFVESEFVDTSDPVGNTLQTGGPTRFREDDFATSAGVRRKNRMGGRFEIAQEVGHRDSNSVFFTPPNQGNARLTFSYTQPILKGAGRAYNTRLTMLAEIDSEASENEFSAELQNHLLEITRAYWELYLQRSNLLQKQRLRAAAQEVLQELQRREDLDALRSQIVRAKAAVASRVAEVERAKMGIGNSESRIRALVNDPELGNSVDSELIPKTRPHQFHEPMQIGSAVETAFQHRPELSRAIQQVRAAGVRLDVSRNELLPFLNLVVESYVSGLRGNSNVGGAILDQYQTGEPSYTVGLQYEKPFGNRRARARFTRRRLELRQLESQVQATMSSLRYEVEVAVREVTTSFREMQANYQAVLGEEAEVSYLYDRWTLLPGEARSASIILEELLDAQERLSAAELAFTNSQLNFNVSQMAYQRALGTLLETEQISFTRFCDGDIPEIYLDAASSGRRSPLMKTDKDGELIPNPPADATLNSRSSPPPRFLPTVERPSTPRR